MWQVQVNNSAATAETDNWLHVFLKANLEDFDIKDNENNHGNEGHGSVLLQPCLPGKFLGTPFEIFGFGPKFVADVRHMFQLFTAIQDFVNVAFHDGLDFSQIVVQLTFALLWRCIFVFSLFALNDRVVPDELKGSSRLIDLGAPLCVPYQKQKAK